MMDDNEQHRVTLAKFSWLQDAQLLRARLESAGIRAWIPEEFIGTINPFATAMQVRVQVDADQLEDAKAVLNDAPEANPIPRCPHCGSAHVVMKSKAPRNWLRALVGLLFTVPMRRSESERVCEDCGKTI